MSRALLKLLISTHELVQRRKWSSIEDIELETRALTEPLPTNQQVVSKEIEKMLLNIVDGDIYLDFLSLCRPTKVIHFMP